MKRSRRLHLHSVLCFAALFIAAVLSISGCAKRERHGQVFVVTNGGENIKMGLVEIHVATAEQLAPITSRLALGLITSDETFKRVEQQTDVDTKALTAFEDKLKQMTPAGLSVPHIDQLLSESAARRGKAKEAQDEANAVFYRTQNRLADDLFAALPEAAAKTDADGRFTIDAAAGDWLLARAQQKLSGSNERFVWGLKVKEDRQIMVSNDSLLDEGFGLPKFVFERADKVRLEEEAKTPPVTAELAKWIEASTVSAQAAVAEATAREKQRQEEENLRLAAEAEARRKAEAEAAAKAAAEAARQAAEAARQAEEERRAELLAAEQTREKLRAEARLATEKRLAWVGGAMRRTGYSEDLIRRTLTTGGKVAVLTPKHSRLRGKTPWGLDDIVAIAAGDSTVVAARSDGTVIAWGVAIPGEREVPRDLTGVVTVAAAGNHYLALRYDGTVVGWGNDPGSPEAVPPDLSGVVAITTGRSISGAVKADGSFVQWGADADGSAPKVGPVVAIGLSRFKTTVLERDGTMDQWLTGNDLEPDRWGGVRAFSVGEFRTLMIDEDGEVVCSADNFTIPREVQSAKPILAVAMADVFGLAYSQDGRLFSFGAGPPSLPSDLGPVGALAAGDDFAVVLHLDREPMATEKPPPQAPAREPIAAQPIPAPPPTAQPIPASPPAAQVTSRPVANQTWRIESLAMELSPIPAGTFEMGSNHGGFGDNEHPITTVTLKGFWMGRTAVTQAQYRAIMDRSPSHAEGPTLPVENVTWDDAVAFCRRLTEQERNAGRLPAGYRYTLPTEAQREYACRAGEAADAPVDMKAIAWYGSIFGSTHPVATKEANAWGLYDMQGNVYEWCSDWYGPYPGGSVSDPAGPATGSERVIRGGAWNCPASFCRSTFRYHKSPDSSALNIGFRIVLVQDAAP